MRKARHGGSGHASGRQSANHGIVRDREIGWIGETNRQATFTVDAMAARAVLRIERVKVDNVIGLNGNRIRGGFAWQARAAGRDERGSKNGAREKHGRGVHERESSSGEIGGRLSSIAPGTSIPARRANGILWSVKTLSCRDTTKPATMPNPNCDTTNQSQSIFLSSRGFRMPRVVYRRPDHKIGATK